MKQLLVFILLVSYSLATTGTSLQIHFCMGKPSEVKWNAETEKKTCGKCGMEKDDQPNGCCNDEQRWVKMENDQKQNNLIFQYEKLQAPATLLFSRQHLTQVLPVAGKQLPDSHALLRSCKQAIYIRHCVYLI